MKLNRFVALAAIALLVVAAMAAITAHSFAQTSDSRPRQARATEAPDSQEALDGQENDPADEQVGDQNAPDNGTEANDGAESGRADGHDAAPSGTPAITAAAAQKTAEEFLNAGPATRAELDDENGQLVYSVEIGGTDVKVDAMTGTVLGTESAEN